MKVLAFITRFFQDKNGKNSEKKPCDFLSLKEKILYVLLGVGAGIICGLLGTGGGIILVFALKKMQGKNKNCESVSRDAFAETIAIILAISVISALIYYKAGNFKISDSFLYLPSAVAGGFVGAILTEKLKINWLSKIFALLVIWAGGCMIFS